MFDLTSKVVDFVVIHDGSAPSSLIVLSEEEIVCIDLVQICFCILAVSLKIWAMGQLIKN